MLPSGTRKRLLSNVSKRKLEIMEERVLESQLKNLKEDKTQKATWSQLRQGMQKRREELKEKGIIQPPIRYNKQNFQSPLEEMSRKARADEIKRLEDQRNKLKSGHKLGNNQSMKLKPLKLKAPKVNLLNDKKTRRLKESGII